MSTRPWWLWRIQPALKGVVRTVATFDLPLGYQFGWASAAALSEVIGSTVFPTIETTRSRLLHWAQIRIGGSGNTLAIDIVQRMRGSGRIAQRFRLTPPLYRFVDVHGFYPKFQAQHGDPSFWIQPEIFSLTGEIYQGATVERLLQIDFKELQEFAQTNEAGGFILAALDAFLQTGQISPAFVS